MGLKRKFKPHFLLGQFGRGGQWDCKSHGVGSIPTLTSKISRCGKVGNPRGLGPRDRRFEPCHLDKNVNNFDKKVCKTFFSVKYSYYISTVTEQQFFDILVNHAGIV